MASDRRRGLRRRALARRLARQDQYGVERLGGHSLSLSRNETFMEKNGFVSRVHRKKPKGKPIPDAICRANAEKSKVRSRAEHVFAEQKDRMGLCIRTIGAARAKVKIGMANLVYNFKRLIFLQRMAAI